MIALDHIAVAGETLAEAKAHVEDALGVALEPGGAHDVFHTHNALLGLEDGLYLETIAINPDTPKPDRARWFDLDRFTGAPRLTNWICRSDDLEQSCAAMFADFGLPVALQRGDLQWRMAVPDSGVLPFDNIAPALMQWQADMHPAKRLAPSGLRLRRLTLAHPDGHALAKLLAAEFQDDRVVIEMGAPALCAEFDTPHGPRQITG